MLIELYSLAAVAGGKEEGYQISTSGVNINFGDELDAVDESLRAALLDASRSYDADGERLRV
jgi:hypothetical protein